jgi:dTDP-4-amino-4,6-dideoxygalactose transaminase
VNDYGVPFWRTPDLTEGLKGMCDAYERGMGTHGPDVDLFEARLAAYWSVPAENVVAVMSGTDAMEAAWRALVPSTVLMPAIQWAAAPNAVYQCRLNVMFHDVDDGLVPIDDGQMLPHQAERVGVLAWHPYGIEDEEPDRAFVATEGIETVTVVDAAHAFELPINSAVDATCFSFHAVKSLPLGAGGAVVFRRAADARWARQWAMQGCTVAVNGGRLHTQQGRRARITAPLAAMGTALLSKVDTWLEERQEVVERYVAACKELEIHHVERRPDVSDAAHAFAVLIEDSDRFRRFLGAFEGGIATDRKYRALPAQPIWRHHPGKYGNAMVIGEMLVALPLWPGMDTEVDKVHRALTAWTEQEKGA